MTEPPGEHPPPEEPPEPEDLPADRTRAMKLPPVPTRPPTAARPATPPPAPSSAAPAGPPPGEVVADQPTDQLPPPAGQPGPDPTLRFGAPAPPAPGPSGYGSPGYPPPGPPPPGYGPPGYGAPGYGAPGYGAPPRSRPLWPWLLTLAVLLIGSGVLLVLLLHRGRDDGGDPAATSPPGGSVPSSTSAAPSSSSSPPSSSEAPPAGTGDELNDPDSPAFAAAWVQSLVDGDAATAYEQLCADGRDQLDDPEALQADFESFLGGRIETGSVTDAVGADGDDYVTISATLDSGDDLDFAVVVVQEGGGPAACGYLDPGDIP